MKIHETTRADGTLAPVDLRREDGELVVESDEGSCALPDHALASIMERYGAPIETGTKVTDVDAIDMGDGTRLRHVRHLARYDVIAKDWLIYEARGREPICALANTVASALLHLARIAARTPDTGS